MAVDALRRRLTIVVVCVGIASGPFCAEKGVGSGFRVVRRRHRQTGLAASLGILTVWTRLHLDVIDEYNINEYSQTGIVMKIPLNAGITVYRLGTTKSE